ncbi:uncharacterized protein [Haliotis asinina]|uniref:uncharacterized protein n=1 Tax=Haliotis asinina TaxID=109174 RepID=UPI0035318D08
MVTLKVSVLADCWDTIVLGAEMDPEVPQRQDDCQEDIPWTEVDQGLFWRQNNDHKDARLPGNNVDTIILGAELDPEVPQRQDDCQEDIPWTEVDQGFFGRATEDQTGRCFQLYLEENISLTYSVHSLSHSIQPFRSD